jgi:hypothetical protein
MQTEGKFATSDIYFAAYLKVAGVPHVDTTREGTRVYFIFDQMDGLKDLKNQFFNRTAKVSALAYADEIRNLKALTHMVAEEGA